MSYPDGGDQRTVRYTKDMLIPTGTVTVRATAVGHRSYERRLTVEAQPLPTPYGWRGTSSNLAARSGTVFRPAAKARCW